MYYYQIKNIANILVFFVKILVKLILYLVVYFCDLKHFLLVKLKKYKLIKKNELT